MSLRRIALLTKGTRGDIQPFAALGLGLRSVGYTVRLGALSNFASLVESFGLKFAECMGDFQEFILEPRVRDIIDAPPFARIREKLSMGREFYELPARRAYDAAQDGDVIIFHPKMAFATHIAEARECSAILAALQPLKAAREFPICTISFCSLGKFLNKASYLLIPPYFWWC